MLKNEGHQVIQKDGPWIPKWTGTLPRFKGSENSQTILKVYLSQGSDKISIKRSLCQKLVLTIRVNVEKCHTKLLLMSTDVMSFLRFARICVT